MMMQPGNCPSGRVSPAAQMPMMQPVVCPTQYRYHDSYQPVEVPYIHPIVNVNRQHPVVVPRHYYTETTETVTGAPAFPGPPPGRGRRPFGFGRRPF